MWSMQKIQTILYCKATLTLSTSDFVSPNRLVGVFGYRLEYGKKAGGATSISIGYIGNQGNPFTYTISGDMNGDRVNNNELIFVPKNFQDIKFIPLAVGARTYSEVEQQAAFWNYINQDDYLKTRHGKYSERNGSFIPMLHRFDLSIVQDIYVSVKGKRNTIQIRADILNFGNMLDDKWGVSQRATNPTILQFQSVVNNQPTYKLATEKFADGTTGLITNTYSKNASVFDVWTAQLGIRYIFGK